MRDVPACNVFDYDETNLQDDPAEKMWPYWTEMGPKGNHAALNVAVFWERVTIEHITAGWTLKYLQIGTNRPFCPMQKDCRGVKCY
ncbi:hypothetical protein NQ318_005926 [Aromia moschata]|uniref:PiggyBac transposable element-derived protein domain-containing protein n=1 Tax=Aromia moschata TaxID=1265417 RepID=A0AAV8XAP5_9CUCU|nr:hypothetical protein NQ318_005926 [Aromia moschata]